MWYETLRGVLEWVNMIYTGMHAAVYMYSMSSFSQFGFVEFYFGQKILKLIFLI